MKLTPQIMRPLVLEHLKGARTGSIDSVLRGVVALSIREGLVQQPQGYAIGAHIDPRIALGHADSEAAFTYIQQTMWQLLSQGILVWGLGGTSNDQYPNYRLTDYGVTAMRDAKPQPYDPDGFLKEFDRLVPKADATVRGYLEEAVRAFNAGCYRSAAVMVGAASEKAVLLLLDQFSGQIQDPKKKAAFEKNSSGISIHKKYKALKDRLDRMVVAKKLTHDLTETVNSELPAGFELIRRCRNDAGHPELAASADPDTVFLNLRTFSEYARRVQALVEHFATNAADW